MFYPELVTSAKIMKVPSVASINELFQLLSFKERDTKLESFWLQINIRKGNYCILWTDVAASHQKVQKPDFSKWFFNFKSDANLSKKIFIKEYQLRCTFFVIDSSQNMIISFWYIDF